MKIVYPLEVYNIINSEELIFVVNCPENCERSFRGVIGVLGKRVKAYGRTYEIERVQMNCPAFPVHAGEVIGIRVREVIGMEKAVLMALAVIVLVCLFTGIVVSELPGLK